MALIVYGVTLSPFVRKVCVLLEEKGLDYKLEEVTPKDATPEFLAASPLKKMPAFRDTSIPEPNALADSTVICDYIEMKYPERPFYPKDPYLRARALWFEEYADTVLGKSIGPGLFYERVVKKLFGLQTDEAVCRKALDEELPVAFDYLESEIGTNEFFVGNNYTIADISIATLLANFVHLEKFDSERWPRLGAFLDRMLARPSFAGMIAKEKPMLRRVLAA